MTFSSRLSITIFFFVFAYSSARGQGGKADFLILENPHELLILNKYQQSLTPKEKRLFVKRVALQIIKSDDLLSDGISAAWRVRLFNSDYFLPLDENGNYIGGNASGQINTVENAKIVNDTIKIISDKKILVHASLSGKKPSVEPSYLRKDDVTVRLFKKGRNFYIYLPGAKPRYFWSRLSNTSAWKKVNTEAHPASRTIPDKIKDKIINRLQAANQSYNNFFNYLNGVTSNTLTIPQWTLEFSDELISFRLYPTEYQVKLKSSTEYLLRDIDNILLGTTLGRAYRDSTYFIKLY